MKFLIAGVGSIGRRHLRNLLTLEERDIILYRTHRSTLPDEELSAFPVETDLQAALAHRPDAVIVSNPTALHLDVAIPAAEAGCHLLLEKPVSHSLERVEELESAVRSGGGKVLVGYQYRFHPGLQQVSKLLSQGELGWPLSVRAHWGEYLPGWHPWEDYRQSYSARPELGGGVILTLSHPLDYLRWFFGEVEMLFALSGKLGNLDLQVEDTAEIGLRFRSGVIGSVHLSYNQVPARHHLEIIGTDGTLCWGHYGESVQLFRKSTEMWDVYSDAIEFDRNDMFLAQMRHFLSVIRGESEPLCSLEDGIRALLIAQLVHQSSRRGQMVAVPPRKT